MVAQNPEGFVLACGGLFRYWTPVRFDRDDWESRVFCSPDVGRHQGFWSLDHPVASRALDGDRDGDCWLMAGVCMTDTLRMMMNIGFDASVLMFVLLILIVKTGTRRSKKSIGFNRTFWALAFVSYVLMVLFCVVWFMLAVM